MVHVAVVASALVGLRAASAGDEPPASVQANVPAATANAGRAIDEEPLIRRGSVHGSAERPLLRSRSNKSREADAGANSAQGVRLPDDGALDMFWPLLVVLGLIVAGVAALRRWMPSATRMTGGGVIDVVARQYLSSKQSLCLVRLGSRVVLVGVTPDAMSTLTEVRDPEEIAVLVSALERGRSSSFSAALSKQAAEPSDDLRDEDVPSNSERQAGGSVRETEARIQQLVGRIRALSTGTSQRIAETGRVR